MRTFLRGKALLFVVCAVVLAIPAIALADIVIVNEANIAGDQNKKPGDTGTAKVSLVNQNNTQGDDVNGCNAGGSGNQVSVTLGVRDATTLQPDNSITFTSGQNPAVIQGCDDPNTATVEGFDDVQYTVSSAATDKVVEIYVVDNPTTTQVEGISGGRTGGDYVATDTLRVRIDGTQPDVTINTPADDAEYIQGSTVAADYECSDTGSGIKDTGGCVGSQGATQVADGAAIDTATLGSKSFSVRAEDKAGNVTTVNRNYTVVPPNSAPTDITLSNNTVAENLAAGATVGNLSSTDPDSPDSHTYTLVAGAGDGDNASFTIDGNTLKTDASFNYEADNSYTVRVRTTDAGGLFFEESFTVTVNDVNEEPTDIGLSANTVDENQPSGTEVGQLTSVDPDGGAHTYTLVSGTGSTDNASFQIVGDKLQTKASFDYENKSSYTVRVRTTDAGGLFFEESFTITVNNVNEAPGAPSSGPALAAGSNTPNNGIFKLDWGAASDPDGDTLSYELQHKDANDNDFTTITGAGGPNTLSHSFTATSKEDEGTWTYQVRASDAEFSSSFAGPSTAVKVDKTAPTFGACPTAGPFLVNSGNQQVTISAPSDPNLADGSSGSGVASSTLTGTVDTSSTGTKTVTFTATDGVGNQVSKPCTYNVNTHNFSGFSSPVDNPTIVNYAKAGQAIPLKWRLMDASGNPVTNLQNVTVTVKDYSCGLYGSVDQVEEYAAGSSGLQNLGNGYYQYNWKTPTGYAKSCKTLQINGEGMQLTATQQPLFQFTK
jgi:VCBS repeat-containing protein